MNGYDSYDQMATRLNNRDEVESYSKTIIDLLIMLNLVFNAMHCGLSWIIQGLKEMLQ